MDKSKGCGIEGGRWGWLGWGQMQTTVLNNNRILKKGYLSNFIVTEQLNSTLIFFRYDVRTSGRQGFSNCQVFK